MIIPIKQLQEFVRENGYMWGALRDAIMEVPSSTVNAMYDVSGMVGPESFPVPCVKIDMVAVRQLQ